MEKNDFAVEKENAQVCGELYYLLALLHSKAFGYAAHGGPEEGKLERLKELIVDIKKVCENIDYTRCDAYAVEQEACLDPCNWDEVNCVCVHPVRPW